MIYLALGMYVWAGVTSHYILTRTLKDSSLEGSWITIPFSMFWPLLMPFIWIRRLHRNFINQRNKNV